jgi:hypothetical protein
VSTPYRSPGPYRASDTYRGLELVPAVPAPNRAAGGGLLWRQGAPRARLSAVPFGDAVARGHAVAAPFDAGTARGALRDAPFGTPAALGSSIAAPWAETNQRLAAHTDAPWRQATPQQGEFAAPWGTQTPDATLADAPWSTPAAVNEAVGLRWAWADPRQTRITAFWRQAIARGAMVALPWGPAGKRTRNLTNPFPIDPNPGGGGTPLAVPIREAYIMIPTLSAVVLPDRTPLPLLNARVSTDADRYLWDLQATLPLDAAAAVTPVGRADPVEIELSINGYVWVFAVTGIDDNRRFGLRQATIRGLSRSALLDAPYAPARTGIPEDSLDMSQLADAQLALTGWTLAWDAVDWLVPGGTWSYQDATPIQALGELAAAIGARIETDRATYDIAVKPRYEQSPWAWGSATPYAILPANIIDAQSGSWQGGTNANGIYVADGAGTAALVRIDGTAGEVQVQQIVERLLVTADAKRGRGRIELARASQQSTHTLVIPLFPAPASPGLIPIGSLLQITDATEPAGHWRGQVMGVSIDAQRGGREISVRQTLQLERHYR